MLMRAWAIGQTNNSKVLACRPSAQDNPDIKYTLLQRVTEGPRAGQVEARNITERLSDVVARLKREFPAYVPHVTSKQWQRNAWHNVSDADAQLLHELVSSCDFAEKLCLRPLNQTQENYFNQNTMTVLVVVVYFKLTGGW